MRATSTYFASLNTVVDDFPELNIFGGGCNFGGWGVSAFRHYSHAGERFSKLSSNNVATKFRPLRTKPMFGGSAASADVSTMARCEYSSFELARSYSSLDPIPGRVIGQARHATSTILRWLVRFGRTISQVATGQVIFGPVGL